MLQERVLAAAAAAEYTHGIAAAAGESYEPAFTEHGFRYVEMSIDPPLSDPPGLDTLTAIVLRTAARPQAMMRLGHPALQALSNAR